MGVHVQGGDLETLPFETLQAANDGVVLHVGGDDVVAFFGIGQGRALDGVVDRFGAAGGENDFFGAGAVDQGGHGSAGLVEPFGRHFTGAVLAGRVMIIGVDRIDHGRFDFGQQRVGRDMVEIDDSHG
jgi:hypothetical protein